MKTKIALAISLALGGASAAHADSFWNSLIAVPGPCGLGTDPAVCNIFEDQDREVVLDLNGNGEMDVGDALVGFLRLDNTPKGQPPANDRLFAVFAQEVTSGGELVNGTGIYSYGFSPIGTTAATSSVASFLSSLTGLSFGGGTGLLAALYEGISTDYISTAAAVGADGNAGTLSVFDFIAEIASTGTLDITVGFGAGPSEVDDFWSFTALVPAAPNDPLANLSLLYGFTQAGGTVGTNGFTAGLTILNDDPLDPRFQEVVGLTGITTPALEAVGLGRWDLTVVNGGVSGASDKCFTVGGVSVNPFFSGATLQCAGGGAGLLDLSGYGGPSGIQMYGFTSNADFAIAPIPEPSVIALLGAGLLGAGVASRRRKST